jgi:hypothetical protein
MSKNAQGWMKAIGTGASAAGLVIAAAPLNKTTIALAALAFLAAAGGATGTLYHDKPPAKDAKPAA